MISSKNKYESLVKNQQTMMIEEFRLDSGITLRQVPVAYKTWGDLNARCDNVLVVCHALTGSADVEDWWGPLLGAGKPFDPRRFFVFCGNVLGSPYGTASPVTVDPSTGLQYGPLFPQTTVRDDVRLHRMVLDRLGVTGVRFVVGGSMGGMQALEWGVTFGPYVQHICAIATSGRYSAWCISWGEAQRQAIFSDPKYRDGFYYQHPDGQPTGGLAAARMAALLTYRTRNSFESRFGRKVMANNEFTAQSYLRYQGDKFVTRFDANCYIHITRKLDSHDVAAGRGMTYEQALASLQQQTLIIGIETDGLFTVEDQLCLGKLIPHAKVVIVPSGEGHDGFLLELDRMSDLIQGFIDECCPLDASTHNPPTHNPPFNASNDPLLSPDLLFW